MAGPNADRHWVSGRCGDWVDNLTIAISDGRSVSGGGGGGHSFEWGVPSGSFAIGFSGRSGHFLDQVQIIYATLGPANWELGTEAREPGIVAE